MQLTLKMVQFTFHYHFWTFYITCNLTSCIPLFSRVIFTYKAEAHKSRLDANWLKDNVQLASTPPVLAQQESNAAAALLQTLLVSDSSAVGSAVHCLIMTTLHVIWSNPFQGSLWLSTLYLLFRNTTLSGMIKHSEDISSSVSKSKWPLCANRFHEIVIKLKEMREEMDVGANWENDVQDVPIDGNTLIMK